jgi:hypothetical protein
MNGQVVCSTQGNVRGHSFHKGIINLVICKNCTYFVKGVTSHIARRSEGVAL